MSGGKATAVHTLSSIILFVMIPIMIDLMILILMMVMMMMLMLLNKLFVHFQAAVVVRYWSSV